MFAAEEWLTVSVDLSPYAGQIVQVRLRFEGVGPRFDATPDMWWIRDIRMP